MSAPPTAFLTIHVVFVLFGHLVASQSVVHPGPPVVLAGGSAGDLYGTAVDLAVDGTILVVGAPGYSNRSGAVYVYKCSSSGCGLPTSVITGWGGCFGCAASISGDGVVALGALLGALVLYT